MIKHPENVWDIHIHCNYLILLNILIFRESSRREGRLPLILVCLVSISVVLVRETMVQRRPDLVVMQDRLIENSRAPDNTFQI